MKTETKVKHTPGPWKVTESCLDIYANPDDHHYGPTAIASTCMADYPREQVKANARLIAAAPELLELLKEARPFLRGLLGEEIQAAISKAEAI